MPELVDLRLLELLCSRLCHEFAGPVGAINNGIEMIEEIDESMIPEAIPLIGDSAKLVAARLRFYRMAYGLAGTRSIETVSELVELGNAYLSEGKSALQWPDDIAAIELAEGWGKLLLNLMPLSLEALPRGGILRVVLESGTVAPGMSIVAQGEGARIQDECLDALRCECDVASLTPRTVHAHFAARLAHRLDSRIVVHADGTNEIAFAVQQIG